VSRPRVRLVALDIDGTLLRSDKTLSPRTREAVARARGGGVRVVLVTGRRPPVGAQGGRRARTGLAARRATTARS
jgi:hydroxymethylpyrimidine pyrophosphatase-like HAD family hydrolase